MDIAFNDIFISLKVKGRTVGHKPKDRRILLMEWLRYAKQRVPSLYGEIKTGRLQDFGDSAYTKGVTILQFEGGRLTNQGEPCLQRTVLFDIARTRPAVVIATTED